MSLPAASKRVCPAWQLDVLLSLRRRAGSILFVEQADPAPRDLVYGNGHGVDLAEFRLVDDAAGSPCRRHPGKAGACERSVRLVPLAEALPCPVRAHLPSFLQSKPDAFHPIAPLGAGEEDA